MTEELGLSKPKRPEQPMTEDPRRTIVEDRFLPEGPGRSMTEDTD